MTNSGKFAAKALAASMALLGANVASASLPDVIVEGGPTGMFASPGSTFVDFYSVATQANLTFDLVGFGSLDGFNAYADLFTLTVNGIETMWGTFNMGGGGYSMAGGPSGMSWSTTTTGCASQPCIDTTWQGGSTHISLPISLFGGANNKITFAYQSALGPGQPLADEGWGLAGFKVTAVPEPETYAMFLAGLGMIGYMARRRRV